MLQSSFGWSSLKMRRFEKVTLRVLGGFILFVALVLYVSRDGPGEYQDCSVVSALGLVPGVFGIYVDNHTERLSPELRAKLLRTACMAGYSAWQYEGEQPTWLNGLKYKVTDDINGAFFQAAHVGLVNHKVLITPTIVSRMFEPDLVWTLGHELAHGQGAHRAWKLAFKGSGLVVALAGVIRWGKTPPAITGVLAGAGISACGPSRLSIRQEKEADGYGLRVLTQQGYSLEASKTIAARALKTVGFQQEERCNPLDDNAHPSTQDRLDALHAYE